ncbi:MAG: hypothetical protein ACOVQ5_07335 [Flavobacteriales bacterium]|jgi:hypothetical protein
MIEKSLSYYTSWLQNPVNRWGALRFFSIGVYLWFFFSAIAVWDIRELLWGPGSIFMRFSGDSSPSTNIAYALVYRLSIFPFVYYPHLIFALLSAFQFKGVFIFRFLTWLSGVLLFYAGVNAFNSSYLLMLLLAFYCIPVNTSTTNISGHIFNRIAVIAATVQICIVYFLSGLYKLSGEMWVNGDAIYYTLELERFSREWVKNSGMTSLSFLMKGANYLILAYQLLFPIIIWIKKWRIPVLIVGTAFHLITMFVMNLWDFGFAMLIGYIIFFRKK